MGLMDDLIELFMMGGYTIYFLCGKNCNFIALTVDVFHLIQFNGLYNFFYFIFEEYSCIIALVSLENISETVNKKECLLFLFQSV